MKRVYYHKLIRDKIPEKIVRNGGDYAVRKLGAREFEKELFKKITEEAGGVLGARGRDELLEELADLAVVLDEVKRFKKITLKEMAAAQNKNLEKKGGFKKRLFLFWSSDTGYRTNEQKGKPRRRG